MSTLQLKPTLFLPLATSAAVTSPCRPLSVLSFFLQCASGTPALAASTGNSMAVQNRATFALFIGMPSDARGCGERNCDDATDSQTTIANEPAPACYRFDTLFRLLARRHKITASPRSVDRPAPALAQCGPPPPPEPPPGFV